MTLQLMYFIPGHLVEIKTPEGILSLFAGENRSFYCFVEGLPPPTVRWLKNNKILKERKSQQGKHLADLALDFPELDLHHAGNYTCETSNNNTITNKSTILVTVSCKHLLIVNKRRLFPHPYIAVLDTRACL